MKSEPKIVIWDLETLPDPRRIYKVIPSIGAWPGRTFKAELQSIMSFGYKILGTKEAQCLNAWDFQQSWNDDRHDDSALVQFIYDTLHDADEIVTHNGKRFDLKVLNTRLAYWGMPPLPKIHHVDTKVVLKSHLSLYSNSLADAAKFFKLDDKMSISGKWGLWERIAFKEDTREDRRVMDEYCRQDVDTLEQLYLKIRPFHGNHAVNKNHWSDDENPVCPTCGSSNLTKNGVRRNQTKVYQRYICNDCGTTCRTNKKDKSPRVL
jgi:DNA-directed RNA polymerase subunit RPC12/RpoP